MSIARPHFFKLRHYPDFPTLAEILAEHGISVDSKIYGGVYEALATIDEALRESGELSLLDRYNPDVLFLGISTAPDMSRISRHGERLCPHVDP